MNNQPTEELRRKTIELEDAKVALAAAEKREGSLDRDLTTLRHELSTTHKELATAHDVNKQFRSQLEVYSATAKEVAELKRIVSNFNQSVAVELTNRVAASITPHLTLAAQEVNAVRGGLQKVKKEFVMTLNDMEAKARGQGEAINDNYLAKMNSGWQVVEKKYATAVEMLNRTHAVSQEAWKYEMSLTDKLVRDLEAYRCGIVALYNSVVQSNQINIVMAGELKAAIERFEGLTSETLTATAATARRTITDTTKTARRDINSAIRRPALKFTLAMLISGIIGAWTSGQFIERRMNGIVAASASASTEAVLQKVQPALDQSNERAAAIDQNTKDLMRLHEYAALWFALMSTASEEERWKLNTRATDYAKKKGIYLPQTLAQRAEAIRLSKPVEPDPAPQAAKNRGRRK